MGPDELVCKDGTILTINDDDGEIMYIDPSVGSVLRTLGRGGDLSRLDDLVDAIAKAKEMLAADGDADGDATGITGIADAADITDTIKKTDEVPPQPQPKKGIKGISILDFFERYRIEPRYQAFESRPKKEGKACSHTWMVIFDKKEGRYLREEGSTRKYKFFINTDEILEFLKEKAKKQEEDK